ncbi:MAG: hypothetical protein WKI04_11675, partial [Ferruginibacter sp.]
ERIPFSRDRVVDTVTGGCKLYTGYLMLDSKADRELYAYSLVMDMVKYKSDAPFKGKISFPVRIF